MRTALLFSIALGLSGCTTVVSNRWTSPLSQTLDPVQSEAHCDTPIKEIAEESASTSETLKQSNINGWFLTDGLAHRSSLDQATQSAAQQVVADVRGVKR